MSVESSGAVNLGPRIRPGSQQAGRASHAITIPIPSHARMRAPSHRRRSSGAESLDKTGRWLLDSGSRIPDQVCDLIRVSGRNDIEPFSSMWWVASSVWCVASSSMSCVASGHPVIGGGAVGQSALDKTGRWLLDSGSRIPDQVCDLIRVPRPERHRTILLDAVGRKLLSVVRRKLLSVVGRASGHPVVGGGAVGQSRSTKPGGGYWIPALGSRIKSQT